MDSKRVLAWVKKSEIMGIISLILFISFQQYHKREREKTLKNYIKISSLLDDYNKVS